MRLPHFTALLPVLAVVCACDISDMPQARGFEDIITVSTETPSATRTTLVAQGTDAFKLCWSSSDAITIVGKDAAGNAKTTPFTLTSGGGTETATFAGTLADAGNPPYYAVFPQRENAVIEDGYLKFNISQKKGAQQNNIAASTVPAVANVDVVDGAPVVNLRNLTGLLAITFQSKPSISVKQIDIHDLAGNMLWGDCKIPVKQDGTLDYAAMTLENGDNTIKMRWNTYVTFNNTAKTYYFPVPEGALDRGFSVVLHQYDLSEPDSLGKTVTVIQKISSPTPMKRSQVIAMDAYYIPHKYEAKAVNARGFYKDIFLDGGCNLTSNYKSSQIPATSYINLETEGFGSSTSANEKSTQCGVMVSAPQGEITWSDANGVLVYPDGEPRFRTIYVNGGTSYNHGPSLGDEGRKRIHDYFYAGGSYTGSCAGSFLSSTYIDGTKRYGNSTASSNWSFGLYPGDLTHTGLPRNINTFPTVYTGMQILPDLKDLPYYPNTFQKKDTIEDTGHHGGSYYPHTARNSSYPVDELLAYQYSDHSCMKDTSQYKPSNFGMDKFKKSNGTNPKIVDSVNTWAYKASKVSGRMVVTGSHPETKKLGSQRDFTAMMFLYSMDGVGEPAVKRTLSLGYLCKMDKTTEQNSPGLTKIGDKQYHHFKVTVDEDYKDVEIVLDSDYDAESGIDLYLCFRKDDFAWMTDADYSICTKGGKKTLYIKSVPAGVWYISVYLATTVESELVTSATNSTLHYHQYTGHTEVLDGIAYSIQINKDKPYTPAAVRGEAVSYSFDD